MRKLFLLSALFLSSLNLEAQSTDYSLAKSANFVMGVYVFVHSVPVAEYDYVGKIDLFDVISGGKKSTEKALQKAKKKFQNFDGAIFREGQDFVELIKFKDRAESIAGFKIGDRVQFRSYGRLIKGEIVDLIHGKNRANIKFIDEQGNEKLDGVDIKELSIIKE